MKKIDLGQTIQILANVGVIAGIVFLAVELDQNSDQMTAQTRNNVAQSVIDNIEMGMDPRLVAATLKLQRGEPLTAEEGFLMDQLANATLRLWENTFYQYRVGLFDEEEIEADMAVWRELMQEDAFANHWRNRRLTYSQQFRDVIDELIPE